MMALAKGISGGYLPLAATLTSGEVYKSFLDADPAKGTFFHGHTYTGNPLACAAALASLDIFEKERTLEKLEAKIKALEKELEPVAALRNVGEVRQKGFMVGIELVADPDTKEPYSPGDRTGVRVTLEARRLGAVIRPLGDVIVLMPPLSISPEELHDLVGMVRSAIEEVTRRDS
jgi:adenosylmethionine-8-amino-7-oxononanoate aminotransferase